MFKFWTAQPAERTEALRAGEPIIPDWSILPQDDPNAKAYRHLLMLFNQMHGTNAGGLLFGYAAESLESIRENIRKVGMPSGSYFPGRRMLEVNVPANVPTIVVDFYRFSDLIFAMTDGDPFLQVAKRDLLKPNGKAFELPVTHIPLLRPEWVVRATDILTDRFWHNQG